MSAVGGRPENICSFRALPLVTPQRTSALVQNDSGCRKDLGAPLWQTDQWEGSAMAHLRRREFIGLLGGGAATWPLAARAQQSDRLPRIGVLGAGSQEGDAVFLEAFRQGLKEPDLVDGQSIEIEYRFAQGQFDQLPRLAAELVRRQVRLIFTTGTSSSLAAKAATTTIPLVFLSQDDPVKRGFVGSFNRPGGNATGMSLLTGVLTAKRLELVHQLVQRGALVGYLQNLHAPEAAAHLTEMQVAAHGLGQEIIVVNASSETDLDTAFKALVLQRAGALVVSTDGYLFSRRNHIIALAARHGIPAIYDRREYATSGGLMSYGTHLRDAFRQMGVYVARVLKGEKTTDLPVVQPTKFELVINLKAARALGLTIPPTLLATADEVIE
jgi:putative tryptophan/tyrosine transport system substrate-binding protein